MYIQMETFIHVSVHGTVYQKDIHFTMCKKKMGIVDETELSPRLSDEVTDGAWGQVGTVAQLKECYLELQRQVGRC